MSYRLQFWLEGLPETVNQIYAMKLRERMRRKKYWKTLVWQLVGGNRPLAPLTRAEIRIVRHSASEPDYDGLVSSGKHVMDSLVLCKVILDDKPSVIGVPKYEWVKAAPKKGRVFVSITEVIDGDS